MSRLHCAVRYVLVSGLLMDYGAERSRVNQQHWERVHRLQQQHAQKLRRFQREREASDSEVSTSASRKHNEESKQNEDSLLPEPSPADSDDEPGLAEDDEKERAAHASSKARDSDADASVSTAASRKSALESELAQCSSEYAEMKAELDSYHSACLSDANRRFRSLIIGLTHRLDLFLSTQISPSQLLQDIDVTLTVKAAGTQRTIEAKLSVRCVETFSDLRRRFVHYMREEQGDAVLAFTPDSQFQLLNADINAACRSNVSHAFVRQPPPPPTKRSAEEHREEERKAHADLAPHLHPHHSAYSLARPLAAFRARATRARAGYGLKVSSVEEESAVASTIAADGHGSRSGSFEMSQGSASASPSTSWPPSPPSKESARAPTFAASAHPLDGHPSSHTHSASSFAEPSPAHTPLSVSDFPTAPPSRWPLLILDEDVAVINFVADFVPQLTVHLLGAVVLVSDQAANVPHRRSAQPQPLPAERPPGVGGKRPGPGAAGAGIRPRALHSFSASASRLPAKLLPHLRQHLAAAPPLPKLPPSLTAFFHRHAHPHSAQSEVRPSAVPEAASLSSDGEPGPLRSPASRHPSDLGDVHQVTDTSSSPPIPSRLSVASDESGSSDESVQHVSITHSVSQSVNPIDDDDLDDSMLSNAATRQSSASGRRPHLRTRNFSHPLASHGSSSSTPSSVMAAALPPVASRYPHLSVDVDGDGGHERSDSVIPSQSFSVDIPFVDYSDMERYDQESVLDPEDSRVEPSLTPSERGEMDRDISALAGHEEEDPRPEEDDDDDALASQGSARAAEERRRRRERIVDSVSVDGELNLLASHSFSQSSFHSTPPSALPTPSVSRPASATSQLLAAGILHLPRQPVGALPSSLPTSSSASPFPLPTSPPTSHVFSPLMMSPSPNDHMHFITAPRPRGAVRRSS